VTSGGSAALPPFGGYAGTINFPAGSVPASTSAKLITSLTPPSGTSQLSGHVRRARSVPASAALLYVTVTVNNTVTFTHGGPFLSFTVPSVASASNYYVAYLDPTAPQPAYDDLYLSRSRISGSAITFPLFSVGGNFDNSYTLVAGKQYTFVLYVLPGTKAVAYPIDLTVQPPCQVGVQCGPFVGYSTDLNSGGQVNDDNGIPVPLPTAPAFASSDTSVFTTNAVTFNADDPGRYFVDIRAVTQTPARANLNVAFPIGGFSVSQPIGVYNTVVVGCGSAFTFASGAPVQTSTANADLYFDCNTSPASYHFPYGVHTYGSQSDTITMVANASAFTQDATLLYPTGTGSFGLAKAPSGNAIDAYAVLLKTQSGRYVKWRPSVTVSGPGIAGPYLVSDSGGTFAL
jgi:hypothetical protein